MSGNNNTGNNPPQYAAAIDPALLASIQQMIQAGIQGAIQQLNAAGNGGAGNSGAGNGGAGNGGLGRDPATDTPRGKLRAEDLGYFDPDYESESNKAIVSAGRHVYYRDMFMWIDHLKDLVKTHGKGEVRLLITQAFRSGALI